MGTIRRLNERTFKRWLPIATALLCSIVVLAYGGILWEGRAAREAVTDWYPAAERLGFDADAVTNATRYPQYGFVDVGTDFRLPSHAAWSLEYVPAGPRDARDYLFIVADEPLFYAARAAARVSLSGRAVGEIRAYSSDSGGGPFAAGRAREDLLVPPERALGYQFPLADPGRSGYCKAACVVAIDSASAFWRIYRIGLVREHRRFSASASQ